MTVGPAVTALVFLGLAVVGVVVQASLFAPAQRQPRAPVAQQRG